MKSVDPMAPNPIPISSIVPTTCESQGAIGIEGAPWTLQESQHGPMNNGPQKYSFISYSYSFFYMNVFGYSFVSFFLYKYIRIFVHIIFLIQIYSDIRSYCFLDINIFKYSFVLFFGYPTPRNALSVRWLRFFIPI